MKPLRFSAFLATLALVTACSRESCCDTCECTSTDTQTSKSANTPSTSTASPDISSATSDNTKQPSRKFPLKGVVTELLPDQSALMVKHEAIPGVMKAMTMMFTVDPAVITTVKKGDAITALMSRTADGDWHLNDVKVVSPATP
ncbi:hypothetical protein CMV30_11360 [Nibricoccus aquaticus]|uniref:Copper-binding protein n=1 Tax=Nibricoccus aquaticus TaxID=2576891 RepID=A0A290QJJ1_9BACT|nr:copper-binding protein [Nibricoccus aquaticus]ATC64501.1 hypothetical protein CMV30_11360 [Nibricoccus aquaticus]